MNFSQKNLDSVTKIKPVVTDNIRIRIRTGGSKLLLNTRPVSRVRPGKFFAFVFIILLSFGGALFPISFSFNFLDASDESIFTIPVDEYGDLPLSETVYSVLPLDEGMGDRYVLVNLAEQKIEVYDNGERVFEAIISSGHEKRPTPRGEFRIINKAPRAFSEVAQLYMPFWMAFTHDGEYWLGFHELPEYPDGSKEGAEHLGLPYSGGCIRLGVGPAQEFYNWARIGDKVLVY